ncbi:hypothetical protein B224_2465 [Aeromonas media WS]|nr:hypothetical protein B224_2465 [Aeromonas media WS]
MLKQLMTVCQPGAAAGEEEEMANLPPRARGKEEISEP